MEEKRDTNKTLAERVYHANVLPDGNLNSVATMDVVLMNLENGESTQSDEDNTSSNEAAACPMENQVQSETDSEPKH